MFVSCAETNGKVRDDSDRCAEFARVRVTESQWLERSRCLSQGSSEEFKGYVKAAGNSEGQ